MDHLSPGAFLDQRYEILEMVGEGTMGVVYKARHQLMNRVVAVKILPAHLAADPSASQRFQQEAKAISGLSHPNIISVFDFGALPEGELFLVMDFIEGKSLAEEIISKSRLPLELALSVFCQSCAALAHAHKNGVIHRDLKPSNIMLVSGEDNALTVKLVDFGLARVFDATGSQSQRLTKTGEIFGSPIHMSPEQIIGRDVDARSDIYSFGCVMYEALTGKPPISGSSVAETVSLHLTEKPAPFAQACPEVKVPSWLEAIVAKTLEKDANKRYQSMEELKAALDAGTARLPEIQRRLILRQPEAGGATSGGVVSRVNSGTKKLFAIVVLSLIALLLTWWASTGPGFLVLGRALLTLEDPILPPGDPAVLGLANKLEADYKKAGKVNEAIDICKNIEKPALERKFGRDAYDTMAARSELADLYELSGNVHKAREERQSLYDLLENVSRDLNQRKRYKDLLPVAQLKLYQAEKLSEPDSLFLAGALMELAGAYANLGDVENAKQMFIREAAIIEKSKEQVNMNLVWGLVQLADIYKSERKNKEAERLYKLGMAIFEAANKVSDPYVGHMYSGLGLLCLDQGKYDQAANYFKQALAAEFGLRHPNYSIVRTARVSLLAAYTLAGRLDEMKQQAKEIVKADQMLNNLPKREPTEYEVLECLLKTLDEKTQCRVLDKLARQKLELEKKTTGKPRPETLDQLARLSYYKGNNAESEAFYRQSIALQTGSGRPVSTGTVEMLANIICIDKRPLESIPIYKQVLSRREKEESGNIFGLVLILDELANAYTTMDKWSEAEPYYRRALSYFESGACKDQVAYGSTLKALASCCYHMDKQSEAEKFFQKAVEVFSQLAGKDNLSLVQSLDGQAEFYLSRGQQAQAERALARAAVLVNDSQYNDRSSRIVILNRYSELLEKLGKKNAAARVRERAAELDAAPKK